MNAQREPAIRRHPAADLPSRPAASPRRVGHEAQQESTGSPSVDVSISAGGIGPTNEPTLPAPNEPSAPHNARPAAGAGAEKFTEQHNVRIRSSTKLRLNRAVDRLRYETGDRSISIASLTDAALCEYLDKRGI